MVETTYLAHHGVKGMRWGVRRYQNPDGSLKRSTLRNRQKANKEYEYVTNRQDKRFDRAYNGQKVGRYNINRKERRILKEVPAPDKNSVTYKSNPTHYRYQQSSVKNKDGTYTGYTVDIKRKTAVGKKEIFKLTQGGREGKTISTSKLSDADYDYIENDLLKRWGYVKIKK